MSNRREPSPTDRRSPSQWRRRPACSGESPRLENEVLHVLGPAAASYVARTPFVRLDLPALVEKGHEVVVAHVVLGRQAVRPHGLRVGVEDREKRAARRDGGEERAFGVLLRSGAEGGVLQGHEVEAVTRQGSVQKAAV